MAHSNVARRNRLLLFAVILLLATPLIFYATLWLYRLLASWLGPFAPLATALALALLLAIVGPSLLIRYRQRIRAFIAHSLTRLWTLVKSTGLPQGFAARFPRLSRFLAARLALESATGLGLTIGLVALAVIGQSFLDLLLEVVTASRVVGTDHRVLNLIETLRTPELDQVMYALTYLGSVRTILALAAVVALSAALAGRYRHIVLLALALAASELFVEATKLLIARPRPPLEDARIVQTDFSFPSGHAALAAVFYGTIAYLVIRVLRRESLKIAVGSLAALLVVGIGVSRVYLGVHYPTDVLAGWTLGAFWLVVVFVTERVWSGRADARPQRAALHLPRSVTVVATSLLTILAVGYLAATYRDIPPPLASTSVALTVIAPEQAASTLMLQAPHYTEGLTGHPQEPVSLIFIGTQTQLEESFRSAGWTQAQPFGLTALVGGLDAALTQRSDPAGPVTPSFLAEEPNALAFSLPVGATFAKRHHIRIWSAQFQTSAGQPIWLATASFDQGFELAHTTYLPTHQIAPDLDTERAFDVSSLQSVGAVARAETLHWVPPEYGYNFDGDPFFTDGTAILLTLR